MSVAFLAVGTQLIDLFGIKGHPRFFPFEARALPFLDLAKERYRY